MPSDYDDICEVREVSQAEADLLLKLGWRILEIKTLKQKKYAERVCIQAGWTHKYEPVYNETEKIVYVVGH